jgi:hypothetical protein
MLLFESGLTVTVIEQKCLLHMHEVLDTWLTNMVSAKVSARRDALTTTWRPTLLADPDVTELPGDSDSLVNLILARSDYRTRAQKDSAESEPTRLVGTNAYNAVDRSGTTVTLIPSGITISDLDTNILLAYLQNIESWVKGGLMGHINRGQKRMLNQYIPILEADSDVSTMPATNDGLITLITGRSDYRTLPQQRAA